MSVGRDRKSEHTPNREPSSAKETSSTGPGKAPRTSRLPGRGASAGGPVQRAVASTSSGPQQPAASSNAMLGAALGTELGPVQLEAADPSAADSAIAPAAEESAIPDSITGANAVAVFSTIAAMGSSEQATAAVELGRARRSQLASNLTRADVTGDSGNVTLRVLFDNTPAAERATQIKWFQLRFDMETGPSSDDGIQWDQRGLIRSWDVLQALPPDHVENNPDLIAYTRYRSTSVEGYATDDGEAAIGYGRGNNIDTELETGAFTDDNDPMRGTNVFDATVRHEVGHRVDPGVNGSDGYCRTAAGGAWLNWSDGGNMAQVMVTQSAGAISSWDNPTEKAAILQVLQGVIDDRVPDELDDRLEELAFVAEEGGQEKLAEIMGDSAVDALRVCFSDQAPWDMGTGGIALNGRIYQEAYEESEWVSYAQEARDRKVSRYQFRAHWEWFAEAYAAYYEPPGEKGALLAGHDDATKTWFDSNVDPKGGAGGTVAPEQAAQANGGGGNNAPAQATGSGG